MTKAAENIPYFITSASTFTTLAPPKPVWRVRVAEGVYWNHAGDKRPPNTFHRLMHRLVFGFKWERIK
jgi:hypothetical protein